MAKRGREKGVRLSQSHRDKIANSNVLSRLVDHVEGKIELTQSQVSAGLGLLKKCLPDMQSVQHTGEDGGPIQVVINRYGKDNASE